MTDVTPASPRPGCPPWCTTDHGKFSAHIGARTVVSGLGSRPHDDIAVRPAQLVADEAPKVWIDGTRAGKQREAPNLWLDADTAVEVARLLEMLVTATARQHLLIAAAIRAAAAVITPEGGADEQA